MIPQHSLPGGRYPLPEPDFHRLDRASFAWRTQTASYIWSFRIPGDWVSFADEFSCASLMRLRGRDGAVIFPRSGGHLSKLGMIRAEVMDGEYSTGIHG
jgi:hypothetical protein